MNPDSAADIRAALEERSIALKKRWGQNFLVNRGARERLVAMLDPRPGELAWEIGPGLGSMTELLLQRSVRLVAFEVDRGLCRHLREAHGEDAAFTLVEGDFMKTWKNALAELGAPRRVLGNLPYRSASLMIAALVEGGVRPDAMIFTVQRELAERMVADPRSKAYSSFSVLCQACFSIEARGDLKPGSFYPAPEVVSTIVEMRPRQDGLDAEAVVRLSAILRGLFTARRKTLRNNLIAGRFTEGVTGAKVAEALEAEGIDLGARAEELAPETFLRVARRI
jgi:16S rRNA (adenine1518-N6/adenine1519-N6)-dimethyltransferase